MVEGNIYGGSQAIPENLTELKYGISVTDDCLDWENTEKAVLEMFRNLTHIPHPSGGNS
jgi:3-deoxy-7-phosphoheptulonate synthase